MRLAMMERRMYTAKSVGQMRRTHFDKGDVPHKTDSTQSATTARMRSWPINVRIVPADPGNESR